MVILLLLLLGRDVVLRRLAACVLQLAAVLRMGMRWAMRHTIPLEDMAIHIWTSRRRRPC